MTSVFSSAGEGGNDLLGKRNQVAKRGLNMTALKEPRPPFFRRKAN